MPRATVVLAVLAALALLTGLAAPAQAARPDGIGPGRWSVAGGGDYLRTGYNPDEGHPYFFNSSVTQPKPEWITKISDLPSGVFPMSGEIVAEGKVILGGASTNTILALDQDTGLP